MSKTTAVRAPGFRRGRESRQSHARGRVAEASPSARCSHQIRNLEERLGTAGCFERNPRGIKLTGEGQRLLVTLLGPHGVRRASSAALGHAERVRAQRNNAVASPALAVRSRDVMAHYPRLGHFPGAASAPEIQNLAVLVDRPVVDFDTEAYDRRAAISCGPGGWPIVIAEKRVRPTGHITRSASPALLLDTIGQAQGPEELAHMAAARRSGRALDPSGSPRSRRPPRRSASSRAISDSEMLLRRSRRRAFGIALGRPPRSRRRLLRRGPGSSRLVTEYGCARDFSHFHSSSRSARPSTAGLKAFPRVGLFRGRPRRSPRRRGGRAGEKTAAVLRR
jgi:hypothetical protein